MGEIFFLIILVPAVIIILLLILNSKVSTKKENRILRCPACCRAGTRDTEA